MWFLVFVVTVSILWVIVADYGKRDLDDGTHREGGRVEYDRLPEPIPPGFQIYAKSLPLAGSNYRRKNKLLFAESSRQTLCLLREPDNPKDKNAIQIIGECTEGNYELGYLPRDIAKQINDSGLFDVVLPRLCKIYIGERNDGYVDISYQLIGPKSDKKKFDSFKVNA